MGVDGGRGFGLAGSVGLHNILDAEGSGVDGGRGFGLAGGASLHDVLDAEGGLVVNRGFGVFKVSVGLDTHFGFGVYGGFEIDGGFGSELCG